MVSSIARQSVIIKCSQQTSVLLGNYEFYYLAGLMKNLFDLDLNEEMEPERMLENIYAMLEQLEPKDEKEKYLISLARNFKPLETHDEQTRELFRWGATDKQLWQVHI